MGFLSSLFGTDTRELVLQYLLTNNEGYAREISRVLKLSLPSVQNQLKHLEHSGILITSQIGKVKLYKVNLTYALLPEIRILFARALEFYKPEVKEKFNYTYKVNYYVYIMRFIDKDYIKIGKSVDVRGRALALKSFGDVFTIDMVLLLSDLEATKLENGILLNFKDDSIDTGISSPGYTEFLKESSYGRVTDYIKLKGYSIERD